VNKFEWIEPGSQENNPEKCYLLTATQILHSHTSTLEKKWHRSNILKSTRVKTARAQVSCNNWKLYGVLGKCVCMLISHLPGHLHHRAQTTNNNLPFLQDVKRHDQGIYRCRVDFRTSQTQSFRFNLSVISEYCPHERLWNIWIAFGSVIEKRIHPCVFLPTSCVCL